MRPRGTLDPATARGVHLAVLILFSSMAFLVGLAFLGEKGFLGEPFVTAVGVLTSCPHRIRTGTPCPVCGTTTAAVLLLEGRLTESLRVNPLGLGLALSGGIQFFYRGFRSIRPALKLREEMVADGVGIASLVFVLTAF